MKKAPKIRKKYAEGNTVDGNDPKKKVDPNAPQVVVAPTATTLDTSEITNGGQRMKMGWVTPPPAKKPNVDLSGAKFAILGTQLGKTEDQAAWSAKWGTDPNAAYKGKYPAYYAQKGNDYYQLTFDEYNKYKNAQGNGLSIPFVEPSSSYFFDQSQPYQRRASGGNINGYADGSVITDVNDPNYDPNLDPNSPSYDPTLAQKKGLDFSRISQAIGGGTPYTAIGNTASNLVDKNVKLNSDQTGIVAKDAASTALKRAGQGAALGSIIPGVGTVLGAGIGLAEGAIEGAIKGKKEKNLLADQQQQLFQEEGSANSEIADYKGNKTPVIEKNKKFLGIFADGGGVGGGMESGPPENKPKEMFKKNGGHVSSAKAKEILSDGTANGVALTARQKRYFGWLAGGGKADGGVIEKKKKGVKALGHSFNENDYSEDWDNEEGLQYSKNVFESEGATEIAKDILKGKQKKADGGGVEGPGTGKSDSISAEVKPGSFVVPAENAKVAEHLRKMYLGGSVNKKANLDQNKSVPVKLSNGEHLFSPEEVVILKAKGIDLDALAPNAEENTGKAEGGGVTGDDLPDFDQLISEANKELEAEKKAGADKKKLADIEAKKQKLVSYKQGLVELADATKKYLKGDRSEKVMIALGDIPEGEDPNSYYVNNYRRLLDSFRNDVKSVGKIDLTKTAPVKNTATSGTGKQVNKEVGEPIYNPPKQKVVAENTPETAIDKYYNTLNNQPETTPVENVQDTSVDKKTDTLAPDNKQAEKPNTLDKFYKAVGGAGGVASLLQFGLGAEELIGSKKNMPKFSIGQDTLNAQKDAIQESRFGLNPDELAKVRADIALNRASTDKNIVNASGGNAAVALGNMSANGRQTSDALKNLAIADKQTQMEKTRYANSLTQGIEQERLFKYQQDLNQFDRHEQAASNLMGAGIDNFIGGLQNQDDINASENRAKKYGSVFNPAA